MPDYNIYGLDEFEDKLRELELALTVQKRVITKAVRDGAEIIRAEAELRAPMGHTGKLQDEELVSLVESHANEVVARIGPSRRAFYGLFQELGTAHMTAQPFLVAAFDTKKAEALNVAMEVIRKRLDRLSRRGK